MCVKKTLDYLIVGQGIAGSVLAFHLAQRKKTFCVIDKGHGEAASYVAAGVINPLVLKRMTLSWRAKEFLNYVHDFYPKMDEWLDILSFHKVTLNKLIHSNEEVDFWKKRWKLAELEEFADYELKHTHEKHFKHDFVTGKVHNTAWIDLKLLLSSVRQQLKSEGQLIEERFDHLSLENHEYNGLQFDKIVFCEGSACVNNPFFNNLPYDLNKGELITIKANLELDQIYKKKIFVIPLGKKLFRIGATYQKRHEKVYAPKLKQEELLKAFEDLFNCPYEVVEQSSGTRPTVKDRKPLVGKHLLINNFYLMNGLGSRGCLMAPKLAEELLNLIEQGKPLSADANIERFR